MPEQLLDLLKLCLLALLYLFFLRVARAVWVEVGGSGSRRGRKRAENNRATADPDPARFPPAFAAPADTYPATYAAMAPTAATAGTGFTGAVAAVERVLPPGVANTADVLPTARSFPAGAGAQAPIATSAAIRPDQTPAGGPELVTIAPQEFAGRRYPLTGELTIGRASGCQVLLEDTYVSQLHARVFVTAEGAFVEDLGSTNGTYLLRDRDRHQERHKVAGPHLLERGDQVQVGSTVMELVV